MKSMDRFGTPLVQLLTALGLCLAQAGCMTLDIRLADFMQADRKPRSVPLPHGYSVQDLVIHRGDRTIGLTHAHHPDTRAVIVYCGGDVFHRSIHGGDVLLALTSGTVADVFLFDYPGYGDTSGVPNAAAVLETARAVYDYAASLYTSANKKHVLYGFSLGGMVAAQVARDRAVHGLVLEATSPNVESWARTQTPLWARPLVKPRVEPTLASVDSTRALVAFPGEVLVLAGTADRQAPPVLSEQIHRALVRAGVRSHIEVIEGAGHGSIMRQPRFAAVMRNFLSTVEARP